jgi:modulator of FtsH protease HflK
MAWNEPGNNKKRDPWQDGEQPDLEETVKQLKERFGRLFGGGGGSGVGLILLVVIGLVVLIGLFDSFKQINESTRGVVLRFGKVHRIMGAGLRLKWPRPIEEVLVVETARVQSYSAQRVRILTSDENLLDIDFNVQYRAADPEKWLFGVRKPEDTIESAAESAVRQVVGANTMNNILSEQRTAMAASATKELQLLLDRYNTGIVVTGLNFQNLRPPEKVQAAFDDAIAAREDNQRYKNQAEAYASKIVPEARGRGARIRTEAEGAKQAAIAKATGDAKRFELLVAEYQKAPAVTRKRLLLETMQDVLARNPKVIVDVKEGNNSMMYLPLDKLLQNAGVAPVGPPPVVNSVPSARAPTVSGPERPATRDPNEDPLRGSREPRQ